ncbi:MAG TPA: PilX N-terminal domain-containing pilus assembly protein [Solimonas sp.]|nr:PilX N-terminal domain-containing pilus assembly protein [Solimonas sp.]
MKARAQQGVALIVVLVILTIVTLLSLSAVRFTTDSVRSALNEEFRIGAFVNAQSIVDAVLANPANTPVTDGTGQHYCTASAGCANAVITLPAELFAGEDEASAAVARVTRLDPELAPPPRGSGASLGRFYAAAFAVEGTYDRTESGQGRNQVSEGVILVLPR